MTEANLRLSALLEESGVPASDTDGLVDLLAGLEARYVDGSVPEPGPRLAAVLSAGLPAAAPVARSSYGRRRRVVAAGAVALSAVVTTGVAAAANELPASAQQWAAEFSERYLPFDLPAPHGASAERGRQRPADSGGGRDEDPGPDQGLDDERFDGTSAPNGGPATSRVDPGRDERREVGDHDDADVREDGAEGDHEEEDGVVRRDTTTTSDLSEDTDDASPSDSERTGEDPEADHEASDEPEDREDTATEDTETEGSRDR